MKKYNEFEKAIIGVSDIAAVTMVGCGDNGVKAEVVKFGGDGCYKAYMVKGDAIIGEHYKLVATFTHWLTIYDDDGLRYRVDGDTIDVYRAGEHGCIIHVK